MLVYRFFNEVVSSFLGNEPGIFSIERILIGIGPTIGALFTCLLFRIKLNMNFKGNYKNILIPLFIYWIFPILLFGSWGMGIVADKTKSFLAVAAFHSLVNFLNEFHTSNKFHIEIFIFLTLFTIWILGIVFREKLKI